MKFAFIVPSGLWIGGVEKYTQQIAIELAKDGHDVDYFYTESMLYVPANVIHPGLDLKRKELVESYGVKTIQVLCESAESTETGGMWNNTNLFDFFVSSKYDVVIGSHKGEPTWPFSKIAGTGPKIVETVHGTDFTSGASNYADAYVLINEYQIPKWKQMRGNIAKTHVIAPMVIIDKPHQINDRKKWGFPENKFIFGLHQGARLGLFSNVQLDAYAKIENANNFFAILGGGPEYSEHAKRLGLKNFLQIPSVSSSEEINSFLSCLNIFAHGRSDGEVCSSAIIEAMANNLPIITHPSMYNNGHINQVKNCGIVANSVEQYAYAMHSYEVNHSLRESAIAATKNAYIQNYTFEGCRARLLNLLTSL